MITGAGIFIQPSQFKYLLYYNEDYIFYRGDGDADNQNEIYVSTIQSPFSTVQLSTSNDEVPLAISNDGTRVFIKNNVTGAIRSYLSNGTGLVNYEPVNPTDTMTESKFLTDIQQVMVRATTNQNDEYTYYYNLDGTLARSAKLPGQIAYDKNLIKVSPDGSKIMYHKEGHLYVVNSDGTNSVKVTAQPITTTQWIESVYFPHYSDFFQFNSTSTHIAYLAGEGWYQELHTVAVDGTGDYTHFTYVTQPFSTYQFSPDGQKIAYMDLYSTATPDLGRNLWASDLDGSNKVVISQDNGASKYIGEHAVPYIFTPDSQYIVYASRKDWCCGADPYARLFTTSVDGVDHRFLGQANTYPAQGEYFITADSQYVVYAQGGGFKVKIDDGTSTDLGFGLGWLWVYGLMNSESDAYFSFTTASLRLSDGGDLFFTLTAV
ncbi:MAG: hypothetical protein R2827_04145 [Bdellovibrionales bacterium]